MYILFNAYIPEIENGNVALRCVFIQHFIYHWLEQHGHPEFTLVREPELNSIALTFDDEQYYSLFLMTWDAKLNYMKPIVKNDLESIAHYIKQ